MDNLKLATISIRVSHNRPLKDSEGTKTIYSTILNTDVELINHDISKIMENLNKKLNNRKIGLNNILSFHIHL